MFRKIKYVLMFVGLMACFYACVKKKKFSQSPEIEFKSFNPYGTTDTADLIIGFSDGDGDIGREKEDKTTNLFITYYRFRTDSSRWEAIYDPFNKDTIRIPYTIRKPTDDYSGKPISGEVAVKLNQYRYSKNDKRIKYVMYMIDNGDHRSNLLVTPELQVP